MEKIVLKDTKNARVIANDEESFTQHVICTQKTDNLLNKKMTGIFSPCKNSFRDTKRKLFRRKNDHIVLYRHIILKRWMCVLLYLYLMDK